MGSKRTEHQIKNRWNSMAGQFYKAKINTINSNYMNNTVINNINESAENNEEKRSASYFNV